MCSLPERGRRLPVSHDLPAVFMSVAILSSRVSARESSRLVRELTRLGMSREDRYLPSSATYLQTSLGRPDRMSRNWGLARGGRLRSNRPRSLRSTQIPRWSE
jgi:hypothetical protein